MSALERKPQVRAPIPNKVLGPVIDLNRTNIEGFDVREFYVGLVHDLKQRGL